MEMKKILIIGSGIAGLTAAICCAERGMRAVLVSPCVPERAQSVMAAGGINAVGDDPEDSVELHAQDTLKAGKGINGEKCVTALCSDAPEIIRFLESLGVLFSRDENGDPARRAFGGQSRKRTAYCGASTGKQIVTALVQKTREEERAGKIERMTGYHFHSALLKNGVCYGALLFSPEDGTLLPVYADALVIASGGQNALFGKTTGSALCDGYAAGKLFMQGAVLKNPEFIQYHPTTVETAQKRMLITEAARGEGGRLYVFKDGKRVYFMEDAFGENGNLMPRDTVSEYMEKQDGQVYLDISFLGAKRIREKLFEVYDLCRTYLGIDVTKESIPVAPSVHFFMGGLAVDPHHRTNLKNLYAIGECASMYHGANRLGGNSLLAAIHGARVCAEDLDALLPERQIPDFAEEIAQANAELKSITAQNGSLAYAQLANSLSAQMNGALGICREGARLAEGIRAIDGLIASLPELNASTAPQTYRVYALPAMLSLAKAILISAEARKETRGAHIRADFPDPSEEFASCTLISYEDGNYPITYRKEDDICW